MFFVAPGCCPELCVVALSKRKISFFSLVLRSVCTNFSNGKLGGGSVEKMKVFDFHFALLSPCANFSNGKLGDTSAIQNEKILFSFCIAFGLH